MKRLIISITVAATTTLFISCIQASSSLITPPLPTETRTPHPTTSAFAEFTQTVIHGATNVVSTRLAANAYATARALTPTRTPIPPTPTTGLTATFDPANLITRTPAPPANCPVEKPEITPDFEPIIGLGTSESVGYLQNQILDFLNAGGTRQAVIITYHQRYPRADESLIQQKDVTADSVPELLLTAPNSIVAYMCLNGQYQMKPILEGTYHFYQPIIASIQDMNLDGVDEIVSLDGDARIRIVGVFEWNGSGFELLIFSRTGQEPCASLYGPSWAEARDTDGNGTLELVLEQAIPIWSEYEDGLPWRKETRICAWNGELFVLTHTKIEGPPEYRFQAVQDGDRATVAGDYTKALDLYQQAIFSDKLEWWSQERRIYEITIYGDKRVSKPTPIPSLLPDPAEYPNIAAYARFRIMLLHVASGYLSDAQTVYDTLQAKFPPGQPGHAYAEMAVVFWDEYQRAHSFEQACSKAIEYAAANPAAILAYLGNGEYARMYYGDQSLEYKPEDVCPFR